MAHSEDSMKNNLQSLRRCRKAIQTTEAVIGKTLLTYHLPKGAADDLRHEQQNLGLTLDGTIPEKQ